MSPRNNLLFFIFLFLFSEVGEAKSDFKVTYVSSDHIYIDGGKVDGLTVGDKFKFSKQKDQGAVLEIVFVSEHSASCAILDKTVIFSAGDALTVANTAGATSSNAQTSKTEAIISDQIESPVSQGPAPIRISGNAGIVLYQWFDNSAANLDFTQSSARLNLNVANIFRENVTLSVKSRGRYDVRTKAYDGGAGKTSWENRLWELSLTYYNPNSALSYAVGRILPRRLGGIGYLDGVLAELRTSKAISMGIFGGRQPEWLYSDVNQSITKVGFYSEYKTDKSAKTLFNQAIGYVEELHGSEVSRTFVTVSGSVGFERRLGFSHNAELDINSGWRKERTGYAFSLSSLNLHTYYQVSSRIRTSLDYDKRKNYWTYQYRSLPDSLFNDRINQGLRTMIDFSLLNNLWLSGSVGYRKHDPEADATVSYSSNARVSRILNRGISVSTVISGFDGPLEHGINYRIGFDLDVRKIGSITAGFSNYVYSVDGQNQSRSSRSFEIGLFRDISRNYYIGSTLHSDSGNDIDGFRLQLELGVRY